MRILYHPQVSMRSYTDPPKWLLSSDAQLTKMRGYVELLPPSWRWFWLLPESWQSDGTHPGLSNIYYCSTPHMDNVLEERFNFPMRELAEVYEDVEPDLVICEVPEHVRAWRAVQDSVGRKCPIVAMVEHVDFYDETKVAARVPFMLRQIDGAIAADKVVFPLHGMKNEWLMNARHASPYATDGPKIEIWPGLFNSGEVRDGLVRASGEALRDDRSPVVFLISRLSDNPRTRFEEIVGASNDALKSGFEHRLWVANPNEAKSWDWIRINALAYEQHPFGEKLLSRQEYLQLLWAADVVPIMYDLSRIYSIGACEAAAAGCLVLTDKQDYYGGLQGLQVGHRRSQIVEALVNNSFLGLRPRPTPYGSQDIGSTVSHVQHALEELLERVA